MLDDSLDLLGVVLDVILSKIHDSKGRGVLEMRSLNQCEDLSPMARL